MRQHLLRSLDDREQRDVIWTLDENHAVNAWCAACETHLEHHGLEWNDETEAFADIKLVCRNCFEELKTFNDMKEVD